MIPPPDPEHRPGPHARRPDGGLLHPRPATHRRPVPPRPRNAASAPTRSLPSRTAARSTATTTTIPARATRRSAPTG